MFAFGLSYTLMRTLLALIYPHIPAEVITKIESLVISKNVAMALTQIHNGKAQGPNVFTLYFKTLAHLLTLYSIRPFNVVGKRTQFPLDSITFISKEGKDIFFQCHSYTPISLLNTDLELVTKILANETDDSFSRPHTVYQGQVGFVLIREAWDNREAWESLSLLGRETA